jgi:hypothetical protein
MCRADGAGEYHQDLYEQDLHEQDLHEQDLAMARLAERRCVADRELSRDRGAVIAVSPNAGRGEGQIF